ncbi:MAG: ABC transporter permease [Acidobacteria bacterium]|nr:ABC transporter permease [Acidobacteriota bacterium]
MYKFLDAVGIALAAIWASKLRSFLTVLGNIVAVTSIIAVVSLVQGMNAYVSDAITTGVGVGTFTVQRRPVTRTPEEEERSRNNPRITLTDAQAITRFSPIVQSVMAEVSAGTSIAWREVTIDNVSVRGVSPEYLEFTFYNAEVGRLPSRLEIDRNRPVVLLGWDTAEKLFGSRNPVDQVVRLRGVHFRVIGVNEKKGSVFGNPQDEFALIPLGQFQKLFGSRQSLQLTVMPRDPLLIDQAIDDARVALRIERRLKPSDPDNFGLFTSDTLMTLYRNITSGAFAVLIGVVALSLVVGGIVIMNIMLMVVTERTREIGLRKALGARRRDITWQILTESVTLSVVGGIIGTTLGFIAAQIVARVTPLPAAVEGWSVALGIGITAVVGLVFGLYPAMRAARLDPIDALRRE